MENKVSKKRLILHLIECIATDITKVLLRLSQWMKKYLGIETPIYKWWWKEYSRRTQWKLDREHLDRW